MDRRGVGTARTFKAPAATAAPPPPTTTTTTKAARATTAATAAAAAAAASGSSSVVGVAEVALGGGGSGDDDRRYRAPDSNLRGKFVAEPLPSPTVKVTTQQRRAFYYREQCQTLCYKYFHPVKDCSGKGMKVKAWRRAEALLALVLPSGFPASVRFPYGEYAAWQFVGMAASAAAGVMSTQSLLYAMGLGAGSIPLAATLNWVIKDGLGQLGGVAFSSLVNTRFDSNPKLWRIVAAISLDASMVLELLAPLAPAYFLAVASVANIGKNVSFLAASASRVAIHNVLSAKGNLADVTAKSGAQTILACTLGTGVGIALSTLLGSEWQALFPACLCLSAAHLGANYLSVRRVGIPTFDSQRLELVMKAIHENQTMLTPGDVPAQEHLLMHPFRGQLRLDRFPLVTVGSRLEEAVGDWGELDGLCRACHGLPFLLAVRGDAATGWGEVHVLLLEGCTTREVLTGSYVAHLAKRLLLDRGLRRNPRRRGAASRLRGNKPAPAGEILFDVVAEALRRGSLSVAPFSSKGEQACPEGGGGGEGSQKDHGGPGGVALDFVLAAEQSGWDTSVTFLEKPGAMRLRLLRSDS
eukprot:jgi/Undpi1/13699/HiC_scaffold_9.g03353.m1